MTIPLIWVSAHGQAVQLAHDIKKAFALVLNAAERFKIKLVLICARHRGCALLFWLLHGNGPTESESHCYDPESLPS